MFHILIEFIVDKPESMRPHTVNAILALINMYFDNSITHSY